MDATALVLGLLTQPEYGLPLLALIVATTTWYVWESRLLPAALAPYSLRRPWLLDPLRLLHEALGENKLATTVQLTLSWLAESFRQRYGIPLTDLFRLRAYLSRHGIPDGPRFRHVTRELEGALAQARYAEEATPATWFAPWRRPRARARAQQAFVRALDELEELQTLFRPESNGTMP